jgi:hypothetical protein
MADNDNGALKPAIFNIPAFAQEKKSDIEEMTQDEKVLAAGADQAFWRTLKRYFEDVINQLDQVNEAAMAQGLPLEEIGRNAIVISQVKGVLKRVVDVVQDAKDAQLEKEALDGQGQQGGEK